MATENVELYRKVLVNARDSIDGETPTELELVEAGGYIILELSTPNERVLMRAWNRLAKNAALEEAVLIGSWSVEAVLLEAEKKHLEVSWGIPPRAKGLEQPRVGEGEAGIE